MDVTGPRNLSDPGAILVLNFIIKKKMNFVLFKILWVEFAATFSQRHANWYTP